jgi:hypothetical protein
MLQDCLLSTDQLAAASLNQAIRTDNPDNCFEPNQAGAMHHQAENLLAAHTMMLALQPEPQVQLHQGVSHAAVAHIALGSDPSDAPATAK